MADPMLDSAKKMVAAAELLRQTCDRMAERRMAALLAGEMDDVEFRNNVVRETFLRNQVSEIILKSISTTIGGVEAEQSDLESAIKKANDKIKKVQTLKKALDIFASVIGLAESIALGKPKGIVDAVKFLKDTVVV